MNGLCSVAVRQVSRFSTMHIRHSALSSKPTCSLPESNLARQHVQVWNLLFPYSFRSFSCQRQHQHQHQRQHQTRLTAVDQQVTRTYYVERLSPSKPPPQCTVQPVIPKYHSLRRVRRRSSSAAPQVRPPSKCDPTTAQELNSFSRPCKAYHDTRAPPFVFSFERPSSTYSHCYCYRVSTPTPHHPHQLHAARLTFNSQTLSGLVAATICPL